MVMVDKKCFFNKLFKLFSIQSFFGGLKVIIVTSFSDEFEARTKVLYKIAWLCDVQFVHVL